MICCRPKRLPALEKWRGELVERIPLGDLRESQKEVAARLGVTKGTVRQWLRHGWLQRSGKRVTWGVIARFLQEHPEEIQYSALRPHFVPAASQPRRDHVENIPDALTCPSARQSGIPANSRSKPKKSVDVSGFCVHANANGMLSSGRSHPEQRFLSGGSSKCLSRPRIQVFTSKSYRAASAQLQG